MDGIHRKDHGEQVFGSLRPQTLQQLIVNLHGIYTTSAFITAASTQLTIHI